MQPHHASEARSKLQPKGRWTMREAMIKRHNDKAQKQQDLVEAGGNQVRTIKRPDFAHQYPASYMPVKELDKITLDDLQPDTHHRGKCLVVRTVALPHSGVGTTTIVEDETGAVARLVIYAYSDSSILSNVPEGCFVAVKEPMFRSSQKRDRDDLNAGPDSDSTSDSAFISVDHPSDIVLLRFSDPAIAARFGSVTPLLSSADEWKQAGDASFLQGDLATAAFCYTEALDLADGSSNNKNNNNNYNKDKDKNEDKKNLGRDRQDILAKRAGTHLLLGRFDAARADALESLSSNNNSKDNNNNNNNNLLLLTRPASDWRAHLTAAKASYALGEFSCALAHVDAAMASNPGSTALGRERARTQARVAEAQSGAYDFGALAASLSLAPGGRRTLDVASFTGRTEERASATHGRGLFARQPIGAGELVFVEKAAVLPPQYGDEERASAALYAGLVRRMLDSPTLARRLARMHAGDYAHATGREGRVVGDDGTPVVDVFHAELVRVRNCFSAPLVTAASSLGPAARGLWPLAAAMNHACVASTTRAFVGDLFICRAIRDIAAGEEITQQYVPVRADVGARQDQYRQWWGFECSCVLCAAEKGIMVMEEEQQQDKEKEEEEQQGKKWARRPGVRRRRLLLKQIEKLVDRSATTVEMAGAAGLFAKRTRPALATVRHVERLTGLLEDAHDVDIYGPSVLVHAPPHPDQTDPTSPQPPLLLPRLLLIFPTLWLLDAYRGRHRHAQVVHMAAKLLRNFGFVVPGPDASMRGLFERQPRGSAGIMTLHLVRALMCATEALRLLGRADEAGYWEAAARFAFKVLTGWDNDPAVMLAPCC